MVVRLLHDCGETAVSRGFCGSTGFRPPITAMLEYSCLLRADGQSQGPSFSVHSGSCGDGKEGQNAGFGLIPWRGGLSKHEPAFPCILFQTSCLLWMEA